MSDNERQLYCRCIHIAVVSIDAVGFQEPVFKAKAERKKLKRIFELEKFCNLMRLRLYYNRRMTVLYSIYCTSIVNIFNNHLKTYQHIPYGVLPIMIHPNQASKLLIHVKERELQRYIVYQKNQQTMIILERVIIKLHYYWKEKRMACIA